MLISETWWRKGSLCSLIYRRLFPQVGRHDSDLHHDHANGLLFHRGSRIDGVLRSSVFYTQGWIVTLVSHTWFTQSLWDVRRPASFFFNLCREVSDSFLCKTNPSRGIISLKLISHCSWSLWVDRSEKTRWAQELLSSCFLLKKRIEVGIKTKRVLKT